MGAFNTKEILSGSPSLIPTIANEMVGHFQEQGYEVVMDMLSSGGYDISISKGSMFKAVLGMKTALKITMLPYGNAISFDAGVGIFGKQIIPALIMWYVAWPVLLTQIWGLVKQSKLDDEALIIAKTVIANGKNIELSDKCGFSAEIDDNKFCTNCGTKNSATAKFCCECGRQL